MRKDRSRPPEERGFAGLARGAENAARPVCFSLAARPMFHMFEKQNTFLAQLLLPRPNRGLVLLKAAGRAREPRFPGPALLCLLFSGIYCILFPRSNSRRKSPSALFSIRET